VGLKHLQDCVVDHGAELCPGAAIDLKLVNKFDLMELIHIKFDYMRSVFNKLKKADSVQEKPVEDLDNIEDHMEDTHDGGEKIQKASLSHAEKNSRAQSAVSLPF
jgi:hypothetical protein